MKNYHNIILPDDEEISIFGSTIYLYSNKFREDGKRTHYVFDCSIFPSMLSRLLESSNGNNYDLSFLKKTSTLIKNQGKEVK